MNEENNDSSLSIKLKKKISYRNTEKPAQTGERKQTAALQRWREEGMKVLCRKMNKLQKLCAETVQFLP